MKMIKFGTTIWIILTVILCLFPVWAILYFLWKQLVSLYKFLKQKVDNVRALERIKNDLLQQTAKETREENNIIVTEANIIANVFETQKPEEPEKVEVSFTSVSVEEAPENKMIQEKQKKLLEKISYEANIYKKEWKLEDYEKKLIEWLAIDPENLELNK